MSALICNNEKRRNLVRQQQQLHGLDYLEVGASQLSLTVHFLGKSRVELDESNIRIEGGRRIRDIRVTSVKVVTQDDVEFDDIIEVVVDKAGDFSDYSLRVVEKNEWGDWQPHSQFDPRYDRIKFNFKIDCPRDLDCKQDLNCPAEHAQEPVINYLAKDYASFRQLIMDRMALLMPDWRERHVPDIGIALVEMLAYVGDYLSYYQDAVATEAYLDTSRKRISVRRHARLVDYAMHEGCNARAWVCINVSSDLLDLQPDQVRFIAGFDDTSMPGNSVLKVDELEKSPAGQYEVFEPVSIRQINLYESHNVIRFYTWCDQLCCIPKGATTATLAGRWIALDNYDEPECDQESNFESGDSADEIYSRVPAPYDTGDASANLYLKSGDVLVFEEVLGPETGHPQDANPEHRHAVRLTSIHGDIDPLNGQPVTHICWSEEDALPFPLCLSNLGQAPDCRMLEDISVAFGNVVLVDHGRTVDEDLPEMPEGEVSECCKKEGLAGDVVIKPGVFNPVLSNVPLTFCERFEENTPASRSLAQNVRRAIPKIRLLGDPGTVNEQNWIVKPDLFSSQAEDYDFVAEMDNDGRAHLRFGNGETGRRPEAGTRFNASYRIGNGLSGNVGAGMISRVVFNTSNHSGINIGIRNPMPAQGGTAPESITDVKLFAPQSFRKQLQRAIVADDYAAIVLREFKDQVQNAVAKLRWNGSWYEVMVAIDPFGEVNAGSELLDEIHGRLHRYRRMGHDLVVMSAQRVPLDIELMVCVSPDYLRGHVKSELLSVFSNKRLDNGSLGFFHPDNVTFGEDIHLSKLVACAQAVEGVASVRVSKMQRWCEPANNEIETGVLPMGSFEIAQLDNDPSLAENGILTLDMRGGR